MFCDAGFRPGRRPTFVLAKVGKTIDAQSGHIGGADAGLKSGPTRCAQTRPAGCKSVRPKSLTAGVGEGQEGAGEVQITRHMRCIPCPFSLAESRHALMKLRYMTQNLEQQT